jgi:RND family efflux transporter MFP subunit
MNTRTLLLSTMTIVFLTFYGCKNANKEVEVENKKYVKIETVKNSYEGEKLVFNGKIKEKSLTTLSSRVGGPLVEFNVKVGDYVQKGQIIARIDKRDYLLQVQSTKAQYTQLSGEYERYKKLFEDNKLPANSFEKIEMGYLMAKTAYENATNQLTDTDIKAPYSGYIYEKITENHQTVGPGQPVVSILDLSSLEVIISVPENQITDINNSTQNYLKVKNANITNLPIKLISVGEKPEKDGMYELRFALNNQNKLVSPGMSAEVTMLCHQKNKGISIPSSAIFNDGQNNCVWIYNDHSKSVHKQIIVLKNISEDGDIEVISGLNTGDIIVTAGVNYISEGQKVNVIENPSETNIGDLL